MDASFAKSTLDGLVQSHRQGADVMVKLDALAWRFDATRLADAPFLHGIPRENPPS
jgi:hypothetical protein